MFGNKNKKQESNMSDAVNVEDDEVPISDEDLDNSIPYEDAAEAEEIEAEEREEEPEEEVKEEVKEIPKVEVKQVKKETKKEVEEDVEEEEQDSISPVDSNQVRSVLLNHEGRLQQLESFIFRLKNL